MFKKYEMTTYERMSRIYDHKEPDRVPITDWIWPSTIDRWRREGLPSNIDTLDICKYLGMDNIVELSIMDIDTTPRFESKIIEETDTYIIEQDAYGITKKNFKPISSTFEHIDHKIKDPDSWLKAKENMTPTSDRINWNRLRRNYKRWREEGAWIIASPWYGYDVVSTRMCGSVTIFYAMAENPEWAADMFNHGCDLSLKLLDMIWDEGYTFDELFWYDDMAYRNGMLFSKAMWKELLRPYQQRTVEWAHSHGIKVQLHCCGNINSLIPELIELGIDALNPLEVKAGMVPTEVKKLYGKDLVLKGGFDVRNWGIIEKAEADIKTVLPVMMNSGGYIFASDHSIPDSVSFENYKQIIKLVKKIGKYN